jgi:methionyl-tRNA formyltransferase
MRVFLITQDEARFLPRMIATILAHLPSDIQCVGAVVLPESPFGKKLSFLGRVREAIRIFGAGFVLRKGFGMAAARMAAMLGTGASVRKILDQRDIHIVEDLDSINDPAFIQRIRNMKIDVILSLSANQIFRRPLLSAPTWGCLNVHGGKLPRYRGLMPTFWTLYHDEDEGAVTVFQMDEGIDSGPILEQGVYPIQKGERLDSLILKSKMLAVDLVIAALKSIHEGTATLKPNPADEKTYFSFPTREDVLEFRRKGHRF